MFNLGEEKGLVTRDNSHVLVNIPSCAVQVLVNIESM